MTTLARAAYRRALSSIQERVRTAQVRAATAAQRELVLLYWDIGHEITRLQSEHGWGAKVIDHLSRDLRADLPDTKGFSIRNLKYMRAFAEAWPDRAIVQQVVAQLPWSHQLVLLDKLGAAEERLFYLRAGVEHGWSRNVLALQIESRLHLRQGQAVTNFHRTLPAPASDLAQQTIKDPYLFDFLSLAADARERDVERALLHHIRDFLLELGVGFAFVGHQVRIEVSGEEFFLDLLFYHLRLRRYVVIELKAGPFRPEYAGKLNFYLSAVDDIIRHPDDQSSIGILLCRARDRLIVEYALRDIAKPIGVAEWTTRLVESLPEELAGVLPTVEDIESHLAPMAPAPAGQDDPRGDDQS